MPLVSMVDLSASHYSPLFPQREDFNLVDCASHGIPCYGLVGGQTAFIYSIHHKDLVGFTSEAPVFDLRSRGPAFQTRTACQVRKRCRDGMGGVHFGEFESN